MVVFPNLRLHVRSCELPTWSRSSLCNSTCCVCWDPMNIEYYVKSIVDLSCLCYLWSCMLSVVSRCFVAYLCFICASPGSTASTHSYKMKYQEYKGLYYNAWSTNDIVFCNSSSKRPQTYYNSIKLLSKWNYRSSFFMAPQADVLDKDSWPKRRNLQSS
jgi:hypothetical protein